MRLIAIDQAARVCWGGFLKGYKQATQSTTFERETREMAQIKFDQETW